VTRISAVRLAAARTRPTPHAQIKLQNAQSRILISVSVSGMKGHLIVPYDLLSKIIFFCVNWGFIRLVFFSLYTTAVRGFCVSAPLQLTCHNNIRFCSFRFKTDIPLESLIATKMATSKGSLEDLFSQQEKTLHHVARFRVYSKRARGL
jgi:hypothetical protein